MKGWFCVLLFIALCVIGVLGAGVQENVSKVAAQFTPHTGYGYPRVATYGNTSLHPGSRFGNVFINTFQTLLVYGGLTNIDSAEAIQTTDIWTYDIFQKQWINKRGPSDSLSYPSFAPEKFQCQVKEPYSPGRRINYGYGYTNVFFIFGGQIINDNNNGDNDNGLSEPLGDYWVLYGSCWSYNGGGKVPYEMPSLNFSLPSPRILSISVPHSNFIIGGYSSSSSSDFIQDIWKVDSDMSWTSVWNANLQVATNFPSFSNSPIGTDGDKIFSRLYNESIVWGVDNNLYILSEAGFWSFNASTGLWAYLSPPTRKYSVSYNDETCKDCNPGNRKQSQTWVANYLYLQGGYVDQIGWVNDTWRYDRVYQQWFWISGDAAAHSTREFTSNFACSPINCYYYGSTNSSTENVFMELSTEGDIKQITKLPKFSVYLLGETKETIHPGSLEGAGMVSDGDDIYIVGGKNLIGELTNAIWKYSTKNNTWQYVTSGFFDAQEYPTIFFFQNRIYILNSRLSSSGINKLQLYEVKTGIRSTSSYLQNNSAENFPSLRSNTAHWFDGKRLWMFGGTGYGDTGDVIGLLSDLWVLDPDLNSWTLVSGSLSINNPTTTTMPGGRSGSMMTGKENELWLYGGQSYDSDKNLWHYNITTNTWSIASFVSPTSYPALYYTNTLASPGNLVLSSMFYFKNHLFIFGGNNVGDKTIKNDIWAFNITNAKWYWIEGSNSSLSHNTPSLVYPPAGRMSFCSVQRGNTAWFYGGVGFLYSNRTSQFADLWSIDFWQVKKVLSQPIATYYGGDLMNRAKVTQETPINPGARSGAASCVFNTSKIFLFGGYSTDLLLSKDPMIMADIWSYENETWVLEYGYYNVTQNISPGPRANSLLFCNNESGKLLLYGGHDVSKNAYGDVWSYDINTRTWERIAGSNNRWDSGNSSYPSSRLWFGSYSTNSSFYLYGGANQANVFSDLWKYNVLSNSWTMMNDNGTDSTANSPGALVNTSIIVKEYDGYIMLWLISGNHANSGSEFRFLEYDSRSTLWRLLTAGPLQYPSGLYETCANCTPGVRRPAAATWMDDDSIYLYGGYDEGGYNDIWRYDFVSSSWFWQWGARDKNSNDEPIPLVLSSTVVFGKKLWLYGGARDGNYTASPILYEFNFTDKFSIVMKKTTFPLQPLYAGAFNYTQRTIPVHPSSSSGRLYEVNNTILFFSETNVNFQDNDDRSKPVKMADKSAWEYNIASNTWMYKSNTSINELFLDFALTAHWITPSAMYCFGGIVNTYFSGILWKLDLVKNQWIKLGGELMTKGNKTGDNLWPSARNSACFWHYEQYLWLVGGLMEGKNEVDVWQYDTLQGKWKLIFDSKISPDVPMGRSGSSCTGTNEDFWMFSGSGFFSGTYFDFWHFNVRSRTWTKLSDGPGIARLVGEGGSVVHPGSVYDSVFVKLNNSLVLYSGDFDEVTNIPSNTFYEYDLLKQMWFWNSGNLEPETINYLQPIGNNVAARRAASFGVSQTGFWIYGGSVVYPTLETGYANDLWHFNFSRINSPIVTTTTYPTPEGGFISIQGRNFGRDANGVQVFIGSTECTNVTIVQEEEEDFYGTIKCYAPPGMGIRRHLRVTVYSIDNTDENTLFSYQSPYVSSASAAPIIGGVITIRGTNFGNQANATSITIGTHVCDILNISNFEAVCSVGPGITESHISFNVSGATNDDYNQAFNYEIPLPNITSATKSKTTGSRITISGQYFGRNTSEIKVEIFRGNTSNECRNVSFISSSAVSCIAPPSTGANYFIRLTVDDVGDSTTTPIFSYEAPSISEVSATNTEGGLIRVSGDNFGSIPSLLSLDFKTNTIHCSGITYEQFHTSFFCIVGPGFGFSINANLTVDGLSSLFFVSPYLGPQVTGASVAPVAGGFIEITGINFGNDASFLSVRAGQQQCTEIKLSTPHTQILCKVGPQGSPSSAYVDTHITVTLAGTANTDTNTVFSYAPSQGDCTNNVCSINAVCRPITGSYQCTCNLGYSGNGFYCQDVDECANATLNTCHSQAICNNTIGSYTCTCKSGFSGSGRSCEDINECLTRNGDCAYNAPCINEYGSRSCGQCPLGTIGDGYIKCTPLCGNGTCDTVIGENCVSCALDCNNTNACGICGDRSCNANETCLTCFEDCGPCSVPVCEANCNNRGTCNNGQCICNSGWNGPTCNTVQNQPIDVTINSTTPDMKVGSSVMGSKQFFISINSISELDKSHSILRTIQLTGINFTYVEYKVGNNTVSNYSAPLENGAILNVIIWQFVEEETELTFAETTNIFKKHTIKLSIRIQTWPFFSISNFLGISLNSNAENSCVNSKVDESGSLRWVMVIVDNVSLYGQFLDKAVIDGRIRTISYSMNKDQTVSAILPHFWSYGDMDPHYSVLLGDNTKGECETKEEENKREGVNIKIIAIIIPVVIVSILLIAAGVFFYPRIRTWMKLRKRARVPTSVPEATELREVRL